MSQPTASTSNAAHHTPGTPSFVHVLPLRLLVIVLVLLLILTYVTTEVSDLNLGSISIYAALLIAVIKSALVVLFFMHLKYDRPFYAIVLILSILFVAIFISTTILDGEAYHHNLTPPTTIVTRQ